MIPTIIVFVDTPSTDNQSLIIDNLLKMGFSPLVDAKHGNDYGWFLENTRCPHRLYDDTYGGYSVEDLDYNMDKVEIMIAFNEDQEVGDGQWKDIDHWICNLNKSPFDLVFLEKPIVAQVNQELKNTDLLGEDPEIVNYPDCYGFRQVFKDDIAFYEITKPNTDRPYTTYVEDYRNNGKDLFSNFFIATSWGVAASDVNFLKELWKWKMMDTKEEFNCEELLKERVERCNNGAPEPRVYRKSLEDVMEMYYQIKEKLGSKRKIENGNSNVKRVA